MEERSCSESWGDRKIESQGTKREAWMYMRLFGLEGICWSGWLPKIPWWGLFNPCAPVHLRIGWLDEHSDNMHSTCIWIICCTAQSWLPALVIAHTRSALDPWASWDPSCLDQHLFGYTTPIWSMLVHLPLSLHICVEDHPPASLTSPEDHLQLSCWVPCWVPCIHTFHLKSLDQPRWPRPFHLIRSDQTELYLGLVFHPAMFAWAWLHGHSVRYVLSTTLYLSLISEDDCCAR